MVYILGHQFFEEPFEQKHIMILGGFVLISFVIGVSFLCHIRIKRSCYNFGYYLKDKKYAWQNKRADKYTSKAHNPEKEWREMQRQQKMDDAEAAEIAAKVGAGTSSVMTKKAISSSFDNISMA